MKKFFGWVKALLLKVYNSHRVRIKAIAANFSKAFLAVFIPSVLGILSDLTKLDTGGHIHVTFLLALVLSAFVGAMNAGVHAVLSSLNVKLKTTVLKR